ncbi:MAG: CBS domain-containing protein [Rhodospirillales bacterium]|nr:CBS domain-containing protein [Rhodospirillales bacterium]
MFIKNIVFDKGDEVYTIGPEALLIEAADIMVENNVGIVVVCGEEGLVLGVVSERDIMKALVDWPEEIASLQVSQTLLDEPFTCDPEDAIRDVMAKMQENRFRHMPVIQYGKLAGIVSFSDLLIFQLEEAGLDEKADIWSYMEYL